MPCSVWRPLSPANQTAWEVFVASTHFGSLADALALFDLTLTERELNGLRARLLQCKQLWSKG